MPPRALVSVRSGDVTADHSIIRWTVPSIAYTPETYVVMYGTNENNLDQASEEEMGGTDITAVDTLVTVTLSNLQALTIYHYKVVATNSHASTESGVNTFTTLARSESHDLSHDWPFVKQSHDELCGSHVTHLFSSSRNQPTHILHCNHEYPTHLLLLLGPA